MKTRIILLNFMLLGFFAKSQTCDGVRRTEEPVTEKTANCSASGTDYMNKYRKISNYQLNAATTSKTLKVAMHIWGNSMGAASWPNNGQTPIDVQQMEDWINAYYTNGDPSTEIYAPPTHYPDSKIRIEVVGIYFYYDDAMYGNYTGSTLNSYVNTNFPSRMEALPIHCITDTGGAPAGAGWASGPSYQTDSDSYVVTKMGINTHSLYSISQHLAHELAHTLDLLHTYDGNCNGLYYDPGDSCCPETLSPSSNEYVADIWNFWDNWCGSPTGVCYECASVPVTPNVAGAANSSNNIMGGVPLTNYYFSPLQQAKMHRAAAIKSVRKYIWGYSTTPMNITANETWDFNIKIYQDLVVKSGVTLTIKCSVYMVPEASVIIEPGAKLILDGGTLTTGKYSPTYWKGVQVWGTSTQHQFPSTNPTYQGMFQIINDGYVKNAINGVRNWKPGDYNKIGGVISTNNAHFVNNKRAVEFVTYRNFSQSNPLTTLPNFSKFYATEFTVDDDLMGGSSNFIYHVSMWDVTGVGFTNCAFSNQCTSKVHSTTSNGGIYSIDAGYSVNAGCSYVGLPPCPSAYLLPSTFTGFSTAIHAIDNSTTNTISVDQSIFSDNLYGVVIEGVNNASINRNTFNMGGFTASGITPGTEHAGIYTKQSSGFMIEENKFYKTGLLAVSIAGAKIEDAGSAENRTYKNEYYSMNTGNEARGFNRSTSSLTVGYQVLCSKFDAFVYAGYNANGLGVSSNGVRYYHGDISTSKATGNTFTNLVGGSIGLRNLTSNTIFYLYAGPNSLPTTTGSVTLLNVTNQNGCASSFGGGIVMKSGAGFVLTDSQMEAYQAELETWQAAYDNLNYTYQSLIDGGSTEELVSRIGSSWSEDATGLRDELMALSPNLSADALVAAIEKNVLPEAMVLEVCLANPESIRSETFIDRMKAASKVVFPEYVYDLIRDSRGQESSRAALENALLNADYEIQLRQNYLLTSVLNSEGTDAEKFSELSRQNHPQARFEQIMYLTEHKEFDKALSMLDAVNYPDAQEMQLFDGLAEYIRLREGIHAENRLISQLNQGEIERMRDLAEGKGKTALAARNVLCFFYQICYDDASDEGVPQEQQVAATPKRDINKVFYDMTTFPNPATDHVMVRWTIYEQLSDAELMIWSLDGKLITSKKIEGPAGEMEIDTRDFQGGMYQLVIRNNGTNKLNDKFVVVKR